METTMSPGRSISAASNGRRPSRSACRSRATFIFFRLSCFSRNFWNFSSRPERSRSASESRRLAEVSLSLAFARSSSERAASEDCASYLATERWAVSRCSSSDALLAAFFGSMESMFFWMLASTCILLIRPILKFSSRLAPCAARRSARILLASSGLSASISSNSSSPVTSPFSIVLASPMRRSLIQFDLAFRRSFLYESKVPFPQ